MEKMKMYLIYALNAISVLLGLNFIREGMTGLVISGPEYTQEMYIKSMLLIIGVVFVLVSVSIIVLTKEMSKKMV